MLSLFISVVVILGVLVTIFYAVCYVIKLYSGCSINDAKTIVHNFFNDTNNNYPLANDIGFNNDISENIRNIIGDKRYNQLIALLKTGIDKPLLFFGKSGRLPVIGVSVFYQNDNEKQIIENTTIKLIQRYLEIYGYNTQVLTDWKKRNDLEMPYLEVKYATTAVEQRILNIYLQNNRQNIITVNSAVIDTDDEENLNE